MKWVILTLGYCLLSALVPAFNTELYLVAVVAAHPQLPWAWLGLTAAVGQMIGKVVFYHVGRRARVRPARLHRDANRRGAQRWPRVLRRFRETSQRRPMCMVGLLLSSALTGLPPFAATSVLAGMAQVRLMTFLVIGLIGRFARFAAVAASPGLLATWWF